MPKRVVIFATVKVPARAPGNEVIMIGREVTAVRELITTCKELLEYATKLDTDRLTIVFETKDPDEKTEPDIKPILVSGK